MSPSRIKEDSDKVRALETLRNATQSCVTQVRRVSCLSLAFPVLEGRRLVKKYPALKAYVNTQQNSLPSICLFTLIGFHERWTSLPTSLLIQKTAKEIAALSFRELPNYQIFLLSQQPHLFEELSARNLKTLCKKLPDEFSFLWDPDQLSAKPFLQMESQDLAEAFIFFNGKHERFPTLPGKIFKELLKGVIPPQVYPSLPAAYKVRALTVCSAASPREKMTFPDLKEHYRKMIGSLHKSQPLFERDKLLYQLRPLLAERPHAELTQLISAFGFFALCLEIFPEDFIAALQLHALAYKGFVPDEGLVDTTIYSVLSELSCGPEGFSLWHRFNEPQLLYLFHLRIIDRTRVSLLLGPAAFLAFDAKHSHLMQEAKRSLQEQCCMAPASFKIWKRVKERLIQLQALSPHPPSYSVLLAQAGSYQLPPPAAKLP